MTGTEPVENSVTPSQTSGILSIEDAAFDSLAKEVTQLQNTIKEQRDENRNVIYAVLIATFLVLVTIAVEVIIFHTRSDDGNTVLQREYYEKIDQVKEKLYQIESEFDALRTDIDLLKGGSAPVKAGVKSNQGDQ